jgi:transcriptional regulator with XRE-family HTH domain
MLVAGRKKVTEAIDRVALQHMIKKHRMARGMTQMDLCRAADLPLSTITALEQGENTDPRVSTVARIAGVLGVTVDELIKEDRGGPATPKRSIRKRQKKGGK